ARGGGPRRTAAGDRVGGRPGRLRTRRGRAVRDRLPLAVASYALDRAPVLRGLCPGRRARASGRRCARDDVGAPDRVVHPRIDHRQPAADGDRDQRHRLSRGRVRARPRAARRVSRARERALGGLGATRPHGVPPLPPVAVRRAGVRQAMSVSNEPDRIELPAPTAWPMVVALGVTLGFTGLVTHAAVSAVGMALALVGGVGWWRCVLPHEQVEQVSVPATPAGPQPVASPRAVERMFFGDELHRARLPVEVQPLSAGVKGGLVGGCAMAACAAIYGIVVQGSVWYPLNLMAAIAIPRLAEADVATLRAFDGLAFVIGLIAHGLTSALVGALYAAILPLLPRRHLLWGGLLAPLLWSGLLWATLGVINPALNARVAWSWFIASQIAFGITAGWIVARATPVATAQTRPLIERAGVEATGRGARGGSPR